MDVIRLRTPTMRLPSGCVSVVATSLRDDGVLMVADVGGITATSTHTQRLEEVRKIQSTSGGLLVGIVGVALPTVPNGLSALEEIPRAIGNETRLVDATHAVAARLSELSGSYTQEKRFPPGKLHGQSARVWLAVAIAGIDQGRGSARLLVIRENGTIGLDDPVTNRELCLCEPDVAWKIEEATNLSHIQPVCDAAQMISYQIRQVALARYRIGDIGYDAEALYLSTSRELSRPDCRLPSFGQSERGVVEQQKWTEEKLRRWGLPPR